MVTINGEDIGHMRMKKAKLLKLFDEVQSEYLIKDFPHDHGFYGYNITSNVEKFIKEKYNMEVSNISNPSHGRGRVYTITNKIDKLDLLLISSYMASVYKNMMIMITADQYSYQPQRLLVNKTGEWTNYAYTLEYYQYVDFKKISKVLPYNLEGRAGRFIAMLHILNRLSDKPKISIESLKKLSLNKIYTRQEIITLGIGEIFIDVNKQNIPIIEEISDNQYIFYENNFKKYENYVKKYLELKK